MYPATERLILRLSASAEAEMFFGRTFGPRYIISKFVYEADTSGNPIWPILRYFNRSWTTLIDLSSGFYAIDAIAESSRRAGTHCLDDLVQTSAAWCNEWFLSHAKYRS